MKFEDIKNNYNINLYLGILPENEERRNINKKNNFIGISNKLENLYHIKHDICKENIDLQDNTVTIFQAEDTLQYIEFENIEKIINEIYRLLKPGGLFRLSLPDYNFDIYNRRTLKNEEGKIIFDSGGGGLYDKKINKIKGGHLWFPTYLKVKDILNKTKFKNLNIDFLHYYDENNKSITKNINYSNGYISRTPDNDDRAKTPYRTMSIVVDCYK